MSRLVHVFSHPDNTLLFIQVFLQTEAREWNGTDRWRMDKFMMVTIPSDCLIVPVWMGTLKHCFIIKISVKLPMYMYLMDLTGNSLLFM